MRERVKAKVVAVGPDGKLDLSIKRLLAGSGTAIGPTEPLSSARGSNRPEAGEKLFHHELHSAIPLLSFEEKLSRFIKHSEERLSELRSHIESKRGGRRRA
jgi:S1 RNA binding domain protein